MWITENLFGVWVHKYQAAEDSREIAFPTRSQNDVITFIPFVTGVKM